MKRNIFILLTLILVSCSKQPISYVQPEVFIFGSNVDSMKRQLKEKCDQIFVQEIKPITAPLAKHSQFQINCSGFVYAGKKRKVELVFQDDQLDLVWILFPVNERSSFLEGFKLEFGEPSMIIDYGAIYLDINSAIRNVPSEILFVSDRHKKIMLTILSSQAE